jgi:hypothetical protein
MIHQPLGGAQGQATDIEIQANEILHHKLTLNGYLVRYGCLLSFCRLSHNESCASWLRTAQQSRII